MKKKNRTGLILGFGGLVAIIAFSIGNVINGISTQPTGCRVERFGPDGKSAGAALYTKASCTDPSLGPIVNGPAYSEVREPYRVGLW